MATLTVPEQEMWVNLSPYEKDRIVADGLGVTEMGRDMLAQDYLLKQLTASLMYPEEGVGSEFWERVYEKTLARFGTTDIPTNTFNKVWIVPDKAIVYVHSNSVFVSESHLKVMLEEDYLALESNIDSAKHGLGEMTKDNIEQISEEAKEAIREVLIPEIEREINKGKNFAVLRQIFNSVILATWYKKNIKDSVLGEVYMDMNKVDGIDIEDKQMKEKIYQQYVEAFKKGVFDYIKEDYDPATQMIIPRKYFSGGVVAKAKVEVGGRGARKAVEKRFRERSSHVASAVLGDQKGEPIIKDGAMMAGISGDKESPFTKHSRLRENPEEARTPFERQFNDTFSDFHPHSLDSAKEAEKPLEDWQRKILDEIVKSTIVQARQLGDRDMEAMLVALDYSRVRQDSFSYLKANGSAGLDADGNYIVSLVAELFDAARSNPLNKLGLKKVLLHELNHVIDKLNPEKRLGVSYEQLNSDSNYAERSAYIRTAVYFDGYVITREEINNPFAVIYKFNEDAFTAYTTRGSYLEVSGKKNYKSPPDFDESKETRYDYYDRLARLSAKERANSAPSGDGAMLVLTAIGLLKHDLRSNLNRLMLELEEDPVDGGLYRLRYESNQPTTRVFIEVNGREIFPNTKKEAINAIIERIEEGESYDSFFYESADGVSDRLIIKKSSDSVKSVNGELLPPGARDISIKNDRSAALEKAESIVEDDLRENPWKVKHPGFNRTAIRDAVYKWISGDVGGIDLNPNELNLLEQGETITIKMDNSILSTLQPSSVKGIQPVIINITPVTNYLLLLGMEEESAPESVPGHSRATG